MAGPRRIVFLTKQRSAASTRYRCLAYFEALGDAGWEPRLLPVDEARGTGALLRAAGDSDVTIVARRTLSPLMRWRLRRAARRLVFDFDDAIYTTPRGASAGRRRRFAALVRRCDQVWAGNAHLADAARQAGGGDVRVLPTSVDPAAYAARPTRPDATFDLVWIGSTSTRPYLEAIVPHLPTQTPGGQPVRLKIVADFSLPTAPLVTVAVPWDAATEAAELASAHVGLAPMPDDPWTRGKCGLKVLQYLAAGIPVVASDVPIHRTILDAGRAGLLVADPVGWAEAITGLAADPARQSRLVAAGRDQLERAYARETVAKRMLAALAELTPG